MFSKFESMQNNYESEHIYTLKPRSIDDLIISLRVLNAYNTQYVLVTNYERSAQSTIFSTCNLTSNAFMIKTARLFNIFSLLEFNSSINLDMLGFKIKYHGIY